MSELYGGARISYIFNQVFTRRILVRMWLLPPFGRTSVPVLMSLCTLLTRKSTHSRASLTMT